MNTIEQGVFTRAANFVKWEKGPDKLLFQIVHAVHDRQKRQTNKKYKYY